MVYALIAKEGDSAVIPTVVLVSVMLDRPWAIALRRVVLRIRECE